MATLKQNFENYSQNPSKETRKKFLEDFSSLIQECLDENTKSDSVEEKILVLSEIIKVMPEDFYTENKDEVLSFLINNTSPTVYKYWKENKFQFSSQKSLQIEVKSIDDMTFTLLFKLLDHCTISELKTYVTKITTEKKKNKAQSKLLVLELYLYVIKNMEKKEENFGFILPDLLRALNQTLRKYIKYKQSIESNKFVDAPRKITEFLEHYEKWTKEFLAELFDHLIEIVLTSSEKKKLLLPEELYVSSSSHSGYKKNIPSNEKAINHYIVMFMLDLCEGLLDAKTNNYFSKENLEAFINKIIDDLRKINCPLWEYAQIYNTQIKIGKFDSEISKFNKRDANNLPIGNYSIFSIYNSGSIAILLSSFFNSPKETALITTEFKLQLILPCLHEIINSVFEKSELKSGLVNNVAVLIKDYKEKCINPIENLNIFGLSLDKILEKILDHCGGFVKEDVKADGVNIFVTIQKMLSEKSLARLLVLILANSRYHSLVGFVTSEYQKKLSQAIQNIKVSEEVIETNNPFFDLNSFKLFFAAAGDSSSPKYKHNSDMTSTLVNIMTLITVKYTELLKNVKQFKTLTFKDANSIFNPQNREHFNALADKIKLLLTDFEGKINLGKKQIEESKKDPQSINLVSNQSIKLNEFELIHISISKLIDLLQEFKSL